MSNRGCGEHEWPSGQDKACPDCTKTLELCEQIYRLRAEVEGLESLARQSGMGYHDLIVEAFPEIVVASPGLAVKALIRKAQDALLQKRALYEALWQILGTVQGSSPAPYREIQSIAKAALDGCIEKPEQEVCGRILPTNVRCDEPIPCPHHGREFAEKREEPALKFVGLARCPKCQTEGLLREDGAIEDGRFYTKPLVCEVCK